MKFLIEKTSENQRFKHVEEKIVVNLRYRKTEFRFRKLKVTKPSLFEILFNSVIMHTFLSQFFLLCETQLMQLEVMQVIRDGIKWVSLSCGCYL